MKIITINEPKFVTDFQCVGSACIDTCCQGWNIIFDKESTNKYLKSPVIEIRSVAAEAIVMLKKSHAHWSRVKFNDQNVCHYMDENKLCRVHATMGAEALSPTCAIYPRVAQHFTHEQNNTLQLSCPEATKLLLTSKDAMEFSSREKLQKNYSNAPPSNQYQKLMNLMSLHLINASQAQTEQGLYAIASLLLMAEKNPQHAESLESYFDGLMHSIENGDIAQQIAALESNYALQWSLLLRLQTYIRLCKPTRSLERLRCHVLRLLHVQTDEIKDNDISANMQRLDRAWQNIVQPWLNERPHMMRNYMMYRLYSDQFPHSVSKSAMSALYLHTAEWFLIKSMIAAAAEIDGKIGEKVIIDIIYSFHSVTKHSTAAEIVFMRQIEKVKLNDDLSLLYLLK